MKPGRELEKLLEEIKDRKFREWNMEHENSKFQESFLILIEEVFKEAIKAVGVEV